MKQVMSFSTTLRKFAWSYAWIKEDKHGVSLSEMIFVLLAHASCNFHLKCIRNKGIICIKLQQTEFYEVVFSLVVAEKEANGNVTFNPKNVPINMH